MNKPDEYLQEKIDSFTKTHKGEYPEEILADMRGKNLITDAMTANEAPEKIYLNPALDALTEALSEKTEDDIEYTRTDAFIDKAKKWFNSKNGILITDTKALFEDFIDYVGIE